ncbi:MAG: YihY/virulence factor BrkB family protein [Nitrospirota bacterium]
MFSALHKTYRFLLEEVWNLDESVLKRHEAYLVKAWKFSYSTLRKFTDVQLGLRATSLVYTTLLSIVPLLAVSFSVLAAFGVHNQVAPMLSDFLKPLGPQGAVITQNMTQYIGRMKVGVLGAIGLSLLFYTVIGVIYKIEEALNFIWRVKKPRTFSRRFSEYLSILLVGPILMFSAIGLTASLQSNTLVRKIASIGPLGAVYIFFGRLIPYITMCAVFTLIYLLLPNTKVKFKSALAGGIFAGVAWEITGWAFATFVASSGSYSAIYAGLAIVVLFMTWLYWSWLIFLVGGSVSFFYQYPRYASLKDAPGALSASLKERLSVLVMYLVGYNFYFGKPPWTLDALAGRLKLPPDIVQDTISVLEGEKLIYETGEEGAGYLPGRDIEKITVEEVISHARHAGGEAFARLTKGDAPEVDKLLTQMEEKLSDASGGRTIKDLVLSGQETKKGRAA